jgi:hypothetical protein
LLIDIIELPPIEFKLSNLDVPDCNIPIIKNTCNLFINYTSDDIIIEKIDNEYTLYNVSNNEIIIEYDPLFAGLVHNIQFKAYSTSYELQSNIYTMELTIGAMELIFNNSSFEIKEY